MNRLGNESSLYLRQHADNPVDWHPWDENALGEAREKNRPILLSIGYSACHWCHVMAHESFEDTATAELMNSLFVNIKVDREERPDLDRIFQLSHQVMTGRGGGWPLTVFLDPSEHLPFYAGTYFPPEPRYGMPAFRDVLVTLHQWYREKGDEVSRQNDSLRAALENVQKPAMGVEDSLDEASAQALLQKGARQIVSRHDAVNGGFGGTPKFPQPPLLNAVARLGTLESGDSLHSSLEFTLETMARSGLRDHLDGGFFRYCVDADWTIPHFEKMLYDNAMLLPLYAEGARRWNNPLLEQSALGIADWLTKVMWQEPGVFSASIDADAGGEEGGFHVWRLGEVDAVLRERDRDLFHRACGLDQPANFEGRAWHLQRRVPLSQLAAEFGADEPAVEKRLQQSSAVLKAAREKRVHPTLDDKLLTSWNALLAEGFVRAARALGREDWLDRAEAIFDFIRDELWRDSGLMAVHNAGQARFAAYLDDYAWLLNALTLYLQARWGREKLDFAIRVADEMLNRFEDSENGGFWFSDVSVKVPIARSMIFQDDATPAGSAVAVLALNRIGRLLGESRYTAAAERCMRRAIPQLGDAPMAFASHLVALHDSIQPPRHVVISGTDPEQQHSLKRWVDDLDRVDCYLVGQPVDGYPGILKEYHSEEPLTAWLCRGTQCLPPVNSADELNRQLEIGL